MSSDWISSSQEGGVHLLQFNRAQKKNALTLNMYRQLTAALEAHEEDASTRVHLFLGDEAVFCAGNDIQDFVMGIKGSDQEQTPPVLSFLKVLSGAKKPIVVGANGPAIGIGTTLLLHCDIVVLGEEARLKTPFVDLGLCPEAASSLILPKLLGHQRAAELLLLGQTIDAHTALQWGLANKVVSPERVTQTSTELAQALAQKPREALILSKELMCQHTRSAIQQRITEEGKHFLERLDSQEAKEAFMAFLQK